MRSEEAREGTKVRVREHHRIAEQRGMVGDVVGRYGGEEYLAVDVRFSDGSQRLLWPEDLEEAPRPRSSPGGVLCSVRLRTSHSAVFIGTRRGVFSEVGILFDECCGG